MVGLECPSENLQNEVKLISESNNKLRLFVNAKENTFLVMNDTYFPGWKVIVDGKKGKIFQADYAFRAVPLSTGVHQVEFIYDPLSFKLGAVVTIIGIMGCFVIGLVAKNQHKREPREKLRQESVTTSSTEQA